MSISIGDSCPHFSLQNQDGQTINIQDYFGNKNVVIYFYPKDNTAGCTKEACSFRDAMQDLNNLDCEVVGISADSVASHKAFANQFRLTFNLLSDVGNSVRKSFKVPANFFGLIPGRVTYIVNKEGKVIHIINSQMNPDKHIKETIEIISSLSR
jgi:thioredoxin-dependent peroxiredoxin